MIVNLWLNYQIYGFSIDAEKKKKTEKNALTLQFLVILFGGHVIKGCNF